MVGDIQRDGDLRLTNGATSSEGRVEMYYDTKWLAISKQALNSKLSMIVCRQLGLAGMRSEAVINAFGREGKPRMVIVSNAQCDGHEDRLIDCKGFNWNQQRLEEAQIDNDIGVICKPGDGDLRLVNGKTPSEGRLQIHHENMWNTLRSGNVTNLPTVVCRQLRLPFTEAHTVADVSAFGTGTGSVLIADITCKPGDIHLKDCTINKTNVSTEANIHDRDVGVECKGEYIASGDVRLVNGSNNQRGRLEIYLTGSWSSFCSLGFSVNEATVACRQLDLDISNPVVLADNYFGSSSRKRNYFASCSGSENRFTHCSQLLLYNDIRCATFPDVGICCSNETVPCGYGSSPSIADIITGVVAMVLTIMGTCCFFCCCCWCLRREKARQKQQYATVSQNPPPQTSEGAPSNHIPMTTVESSNVPVYVHSPVQHGASNCGATGMPPPAPAGSAPYQTQPYPYPAGQAPQQTGAYPVPSQPGYNPTAATNQYPPQSAKPYPPQISPMVPPYGAPYQSTDHPYPQASTEQSHPTIGDPNQHPLSHAGLGVPSAPPVNGGYCMPPLTPPPAYEEVTSPYLEH
ncbi:neurotrypsin isoform X2 [Strongylocentrotus purpuratus]|uniref:SRCR domain-containing protein n=1 Tax=Strongylocentrotus purpuratus TaxID=7668 RepID=A0A7M7N564_STRPU|nr:neurotrypsin isoform X2 [Strongylocentrotus purpuratus]